MYCRKEATWEPALEEVSLRSQIGRPRPRSHAHSPSYEVLQHPVRSSRLGAGPRGSARAPPDVIAARRRLRCCYFAGEVVGANGSRAPITDSSPSHGPAHLLLFGRGAAMVSRPGGRAATEALQAGVWTGRRRGAGWGGRCRVQRGAPLRVRGAPRTQRAGRWLLRGTFIPPHPPTLGGREEGRRMLIWTGR